MIHKKILWLLAIAVLGFGCTPGGIDYIEEADLVYTNYDDAYGFARVKTFAIPEQVIEITGSTFDPQAGLEFVDPAYGDVIVERLRKNLTALGWTEVDENDNPDFVVLPSVYTSTTINIYYDWSYWGWYYPGWYSGWGWYYPYYYPTTYTSGYRSGSLFVQLIDHKSTRLNDAVPVRWNMIINGLLEGGAASINSRVQNSIDQAFLQSPYLKGK